MKNTKKIIAILLVFNFYTANAALNFKVESPKVEFKRGGEVNDSNSKDYVNTRMEHLITLKGCGNGRLDLGEICDTDNFNGKDCKDFGFDSGDLQCDKCTKILTSSCENIEAQPAESKGTYRKTTVTYDSFRSGITNTTEKTNVAIKQEDENKQIENLAVQSKETESEENDKNNSQDIIVNNNIDEALTDNNQNKENKENIEISKNNEENLDKIKANILQEKEPVAYLAIDNNVKYKNNEVETKTETTKKVTQNQENNFHAAPKENNENIVSTENQEEMNKTEEKNKINENISNKNSVDENTTGEKFQKEKNEYKKEIELSEIRKELVYKKSGYKKNYNSVVISYDKTPLIVNDELEKLQKYNIKIFDSKDNLIQEKQISSNERGQAVFEPNKDLEDNLYYFVIYKLEEEYNLEIEKRVFSYKVRIKHRNVAKISVDNFSGIKIDLNDKFTNKNNIEIKSKEITFLDGFSKPYKRIFLHINNGFTQDVVSDKNGYFFFELPKNIKSGLHNISVSDFDIEKGIINNDIDINFSIPSDTMKVFEKIDEYKYSPWFIVMVVIGLSFLLFIFFGIFKSKDENEDDEKDENEDSN